MRPPSRLAVGAVVGLLFLLTGCATTRVGHFGVLPNREPLVTLLVTEDRDVVRTECRAAAAMGDVLGCQISWSVPLPSGPTIRAMRIVRYTDSLPSMMAFEIDIHELCHAVASLQPIDDPCHVGNNGVLQSAARSNPAIHWLER